MFVAQEAEMLPSPGGAKCTGGRLTELFGSIDGHCAPTGLRRFAILDGYKHPAPLGLNASARCATLPAKGRRKG
jgi:hypothetical protein